MPMPGVAVGLGVGVGPTRPNVEKEVFWLRFGSVQVKLAVGPMCGKACARISITTPLVRLISSSARRTSGFCCNAVITAWSILKTGEPFSDQPRLLASSAAACTEIGGSDGDGIGVGVNVG